MHLKRILLLLLLCCFILFHCFMLNSPALEPAEEVEFMSFSDRVPTRIKLENLQTLGRFIECGPSDQLLVFVHSSARDVEVRNGIRNSWGNHRIYAETLARILFVVGAQGDGEENPTSLQSQLQWEHCLLYTSPSPRDS